MTSASRLLRGMVPCLLALTAATVFVLPANAGAGTKSVPGPARAAEWWLTKLNVFRAWQTAPGEGKGVTVAVLSTGVDSAHPDLAGDVTTGRDYCDSGRTTASPFWGYEGTAVASLLAGHGHGPRGTDGITGIAPGARILAVQVTLEYNDPLNSDSALTRRLPDAIASGIRYAVAHGASVIALPLDPGTLGTPAAGSGDPAAAGGSQAERAAVSYALARDVVLIAPAGDNGASTGTVNYPAAYPGVIAVGATQIGGQLASFTSRRPYVALTAPGAGLTVADPDGGYATLASTDMSAALTAGVAALIRSRFPALSAAGVARALEAGTRPAGAHPAPGSGHGALDAAGALAAASRITAAPPAQAPSAAPPSPAPSPRASPGHAAAVHKPGLGTLAGSLVRYTLLGACALIAALAAALALAAMRRRRARDARRQRDATRSGQGGSHARRPRGAAPARQANGQPRPGAWGQPRALGPGNGATADGAPRIVPVTVNGTLGAAERARRKRKSTGKPPWEPAGLPAKELPGHQPYPMLPRARPMLPAADARPAPSAPSAAPAPRQPGALAPWEASPEEFASAPVPTDIPEWKANTGPMYLWNPNATGPQPAVARDQDPDLCLRPSRPIGQLGLYVRGVQVHVLLA